MGEPTDYATRLRTAKQLAGVADDKTLAKNVGISLQAINKIWAGTSKALSAANNVRLSMRRYGQSRDAGSITMYGAEARAQLLRDIKAKGDKAKKDI